MKVYILQHPSGARIETTWFPFHVFVIPSPPVDNITD